VFFGKLYSSLICDTGSLTDRLKSRHAKLRGEGDDPGVEELKIDSKLLIRAKPRSRPVANFLFFKELV
jgi:hypothetical protein